MKERLQIVLSNKYRGNVGVGDIKYKDIPNRFGETDGLITNNDRIRMGYPTVPEIIYGFGPSIRYKKNVISGFSSRGGSTNLHDVVEYASIWN